jgi:hypothetical protein
MALDSENQGTFVNMAINFPIPYKVENFLNMSAKRSF